MCSRPHPPRLQAPRHLAGATLIELVAAIVIFAVAALAIFTALATAIGRSADPGVVDQASAIAASYLETVRSRSFCDPNWDADGNPTTPLDCPAQCTASVCSACRGQGSVTEATRAEYDDVCDYDGIVDAGARDELGNAIAGLDDYTVEVTVNDSGVTLDSAPALPALDADNGEVVRIDVTVRHPQLPGGSIAISGYRANY